MVCRSAAEQTTARQDEYFEADPDAANEAFKSAYRQSARMPEGLVDGVAINGMQQFAAAIWDRQRHIPSAKADPLTRIFAAFDTDRDGHLTAKEVAAALRSRNVDLTEAIVQKFIEASDADSNTTVEKDEFASLILHMASADLRSKEVAEYWAREECTVDCKLPDT